MSAPTDKLIELIAAAAITVGTWQQVVDEIAAGLPGAKVMMHGEDADARGNVGLVYSGFTPESINNYIEYYSTLNPWTKAWLPLPTMVPQISDRVLPARSFAGSEYHDDFLLKGDDIRHAAGIKIFQEVDRVAMLSIHYGERRAETYNVAAWSLLRDLAPYLRMALEVSRQLSRPPASVAAIFDVIDSMPTPVCLITKDRRVVSGNGLFIAECHTGKHLVVDASDRIAPTDYRLEQRFDELIRNAMEPRPAKGARQPFVMSLSSGQVGGAPQSTLTVVGIRASSAVALPWGMSGPSHALLIVDYGGRGCRQAPSLVAEFALTKAEYQLATLVGKGQSLRDAADRLGISYETARSRLKIVFSKTDVHRQAELVALLATR